METDSSQPARSGSTGQGQKPNKKSTEDILQDLIKKRLELVKPALELCIF